MPLASRALWTTTALLRLGVAPAEGATVRYASSSSCDETDAKYGTCPYDLLITAAPGEANRIDVATAADHVDVHDSATPLTTQDPRCARLPDGGLRCTAPALVVFSGPGGRTVVDAGDGDDAVTLSGGGAAAYGGAGADVLTGSDQFGELLDGGPGADVVRGLGGSDTLSPGEDADPDTVDGGPGLDELTFSGQRTPVQVDLGEATATGVGVTDAVAGFERLTGSERADRLVGDAGSNRISGGPGDRIDGAGGDDLLDLTGRTGSVEGGAGDDLVRLFGPSRGRLVDCSAGDDQVVEPKAPDVVGVSCDAVVSEDGTLAQLGRGGVRVRSRVRGASGTLTIGRTVVARRAPVTRVPARLRTTRAGRRRTGRATAALAVRAPQRGLPLLAFRMPAAARTRIARSASWPVTDSAGSGSSRTYSPPGPKRLAARARNDSPWDWWCSPTSP